MMKFVLIYIVVFITLLSGCRKDIADNPIANQQPKTFLWLFPDSTLAQGNSKQRIRWWGQDPDGVVKGYLFSSGKLLDSTGQISNSIPWRWRISNDSLVAFPLLVRQDTFQVIVRAVDNTFQGTLPDHAMIRLGSSPYWDKNENGQFDGNDLALPSLQGSYDLHGASLGLPVLNQHPSIAFAPDPNDLSVTMQQPETTFTVATFAWVGTDPDGDETITTYELALNDTNDASRRLTIQSNIRLTVRDNPNYPDNVRGVTLVVPRARSNNVVGEVTADVYKGTYATSLVLIGTLSHLKLDSLNTLYVRARDIAGDVSYFIQMPGKTASRKWFVKNPKGKLLIVNDYILADKAAALAFYKNVFPTLTGGTSPGEFANVEVLDIGKGLSAQQKLDGRFGTLVPPFIDPGLMFTFHLFDVIYWYSDPYPSLGVAQYPLFQYIRGANHRGKVIFTSMFSTSVDPRQALKDFAPLDSVSSVDLITPQRPLPTIGDTRVPQNFLLVPDSSISSDIYPPLKFGGTNPPLPFYSVFMRPIYKRADARYIYRIQDDARSPKRYVYLATLADLRSVAANGSSAWACGSNGTIVHTSDNGLTWKNQTSGTSNVLNGLCFVDETKGWAVGDAGTILQTTNGGSSWSNHSFVSRFENFLSLWFVSGDIGFIGGTNGIFIRTTNGGTSWTSSNFRTSNAIRGIHFLDATIGLAVGDSDLIIKTTNGGVDWRVVRKAAPGTINPARLNAVRFSNATTAWAVGTSGRNLKSVDGGETWLPQSVLPSASFELRSIYFTDNQNGYVCGSGGLALRTDNGGLAWSGSTGVQWSLGGISMVNSLQGWAVGTSGMILRTEDGGLSWDTQPKGNINVGVIDGKGNDGTRSFAFLGLPLHVLNGDLTNVKSFFEYVLFQEFGE